MLPPAADTGGRGYLSYVHVRTCTCMRSLLELACNGEGGFSIGFSSFTHLTNAQHCQHQPIILTQRRQDELFIDIILSSLF